METMKKTTWLLWASIIVVSLVTTYLFLHLSNEEGEKNVLNGQEIQFLNKTQLNVITLLINNNTPTLAVTADSTQTDSSTVSKDTASNNSETTVDHVKTRKLIISFLKENFDLKNGNQNPIIDRVMTTDFRDLQAILPTYPIYVNSFFWLTSPGILLEIVFWSLFGLMASLLFGVTSAAVFDPKLVPEHVGKFFYTPFLVIIIYLSLNALTNEGSIVLDGEGKGTIVLAFILGFYTRRAIVLLGKIKDIILPAKDRGNSNSSNTTSAPTTTDPYKALTTKEQKTVIDGFLKAQSESLLKKYTSIKLASAQLKPATDKVKAYYYLQISVSKDSSDEIPSSFSYTDSKKKQYTIPAEVSKIE